MKIIRSNKKNIAAAAKIINEGGLVAFPTETVYGLGADGLNPIAVAKIFEAKKRPEFNPLILHISDKNCLYKLTNFKNDKIDLLTNKFWPGPLTLVLPKTELVPDIVTSGNPTVAVRMPDHPVALSLIKKSGTPIAAPSANMFGHLSPTEAQHVEKSLGDKVDLILDGGKCAVGVESTIIEINEEGIVLLRPGGLSKEEIENEVGKIHTLKKRAVQPNSPGQLPFHYSPEIPLYFLTQDNISKHIGKKCGVLFFTNAMNDYKFSMMKILAPTGNLKEAAANLFKYLHEFEREDIEVILVEPVPETGLGLAIMDRLRKASKKYE